MFTPNGIVKYNIFLVFVVFVLQFIIYFFTFFDFFFLHVNCYLLYSLSTAVLLLLSV